MTKVIDIEGFARRVERLCDFLLLNIEKDGTEDVAMIQDLKADAADLQLNAPQHVIHSSIKGISQFMKGAPPS